MRRPGEEKSRRGVQVYQNKSGTENSLSNFNGPLSAKVKALRISLGGSRGVVKRVFSAVKVAVNISRQLSPTVLGTVGV